MPRDFYRLWFGQSVSLLGSQVTLVALPLTAVLVLHASAQDMGLLRAGQFLPYLVFGLFAGAWVDRLRRRPLLILTDLAQFLLLGSIPVAAWLGWLGLPQIWVVGFLVGAASVLFSTAYGSYLPSLVERTQVVEGNSRLAVSLSVARMAGPGLAGLLIQAFSAPIAIALDALSFAVSALCFAAIRRPEPAPTPPAERQSLWREIREGLVVVWGQPVLRAISLAVSVSNFADAMTGAVLMLFYVRTLGLEPATLGLAMVTLGPGTLFGSLLAPRLTRWCGPGPALVAASGLLLVGVALQPLAAWLPGYELPALMAAYCLIGIGNPLFNVTSTSLRQAITPNHLLGRVGATGSVLAWGLMPLGALVGGYLGDRLGLQTTLFIGAAGYVVLCLGIAGSAVRAQRELPTVAVRASPAA